MADHRTPHGEQSTAQTNGKWCSTPKYEGKHQEPPKSVDTSKEKKGK